MVFVFGSNLAGRHGKGAALFARQKHGAIYGVGKGPQGNSYAIPTKDHALVSLTLEEIKQYVNEFCKYAQDNQHLVFEVTAIGTGLAGYRHEDIAPMFHDAPKNCLLPKEWAEILKRATISEDVEATKVLKDTGCKSVTGTGGSSSEGKETKGI
jgi:hypothetical protein